MQISVGMTGMFILAIGIGGPSSAIAQEAPGEKDQGDQVEERGAPRDLQVGDFVYRLGDGISLGPLRLHPYGAEYFVYDDNVFLIDSDEPPPSDRKKIAELSSETTLGLRLDLPAQDHYLSAQYQVQLVNYLLEGTPNLVRQLGRAELGLNFTRAYAGLTNTYRNTDDPVDLPDLGRFRRVTNFLDAIGGYRFNKLGVEAGFHDRFYDFLNSETNYLDHDEIFIHGKVFYETTPKFTIFGQGEYGTATFGDDESRSSSLPGQGVTLNDYTYIRLWAGSQYHPGPKISIDGRLGFMVQSVDDNGTITDDEEFTGVLAGIGTTFRAAEKLKLALGYLRDLQFSGSGNFQVVDRFDTRLDLQASPKFSTSGLFFFENSDPSNTDPFLRFGLGVILDYRVKDWVNVGAQYQYRQRLAKDIGDYTNNRILGNITFYF